MAYRTLGTPKKYKQNLRHQPTIRPQPALQKAYKSTRYTHTNHLKPQKTPLHEMPAPNTHALHRKPPKASKNSTPIFARTPPNCEPNLLQKRCFSGWRTVRLEPLKSISKTYATSQQHQPTIGLQPALQKHTKAPDTHTHKPP